MGMRASAGPLPEGHTKHKTPHSPTESAQRTKNKAGKIGLIFVLFLPAFVSLALVLTFGLSHANAYSRGYGSMCVYSRLDTHAQQFSLGFAFKSEKKAQIKEQRP